MPLVLVFAICVTLLVHVVWSVGLSSRASPNCYDEKKIICRAGLLECLVGWLVFRGWGEGVHISNSDKINTFSRRSEIYFN